VLGIDWPKSCAGTMTAATWVGHHNSRAVFDGELVLRGASWPPERPRRIASRQETSGTASGAQSFPVSEFQHYKPAWECARWIAIRPNDAMSSASIAPEKRAPGGHGILSRGRRGVEDEVVGLVEWPVVLMGRSIRLHRACARGSDHGDAQAPEKFRA